VSQTGKPRNALWIRFAAVLAVVAVFIAVCEWTPVGATVNLRQVSDWFAPHRYAWYALPIVVGAYILLGLALVPVLLLVAATGMAFGPWLGPIYAMAGCLASASTGFAIGRRVGFQRIERLGGPRVTRVGRALERNGTLAVFLLRKVPAPFLFGNIVAGASRVRYRDFVAGTALGMGAGVVALAGFGYQAANAFRNPSLLTVIGAAMMIGLPLFLAWLINRQLARRRIDPSLEVLVEGGGRAS
jgi:phospholipase D1/2